MKTPNFFQDFLPEDNTTFFKKTLFEKNKRKSGDSEQRIEKNSAITPFRESEVAKNGVNVIGGLNKKSKILEPEKAFPCDDNMEDTDGIFSVRVQPPTPRAITPTQEFCVGVGGPTVAEQLEAKMERQIARHRNSLPYSETEDSGQTGNESDPDLNDLLTPESEHPESDQPGTEEADVNLAPEADQTQILSEIEHYTILARVTKVFRRLKNA